MDKITATDAALVDMGNAMRVLAKLARDDAVKALLGPGMANEITTAAAGFRQRFPLQFAGIAPDHSTVAEGE